jgi:hypothetical protein
MKIQITKTVTVLVGVDVDKLNIVMGGMRDVESTNFEVYYDMIEVAFGHLNLRSNMAHVSMIENTTDESGEFEAFLVNAIENGNY